MTRTTLVETMTMTSIQLASILQVGDSVQVTPYSNVLAVQREKPIYNGNEGALSAFPTFSQEIPYVSIDERVSLSVHNADPFIRVRGVRVIGLSASSIAHIGNTSFIAAEVRTKHIRQLLPETAEAGAESPA